LPVNQRKDDDALYFENSFDGISPGQTSAKNFGNDRQWTAREKAKITFLEMKYRSLVEIHPEEFDYVSPENELEVHLTTPEKFYFKSPTNGRLESATIKLIFFNEENLSVKMVSDMLQIFCNGKILLSRTKNPNPSPSSYSKGQITPHRTATQAKIKFEFESGSQFQSDPLEPYSNIKNLDQIYVKFYQKNSVLGIIPHE
jgi:hypothetical protein